MGIEESVHFVGYITHDHLPKIYATSDIVVIPSQIQESFGLALAEGMACGKPVIGSNIPGQRSVVQNGVSGLLVSPGDVKALSRSIKLLIDNPDLRKTIGCKARARIEQKFSWNLVGKKLHSLYRSVIMK